MKTVVASDIHSNLEYTKKLVNFIEIKNPDNIILLGDIFNGKNDLEILDLLNKYSDRIMSVYGNCNMNLDNISNTGSSVNGRSELKAEVLVYLPDENRIEYIEEIIGLEPTKYRIGDFLQLKYYEGDINIINLVNKDSIPQNIRELLSNYFKESDIIVFNNETYVKVKNDIDVTSSEK